MDLVEYNTFSEIPPGFTGVVKLPDDIIYWLKDGKIHCEDGPAIETPNGTRYWLQNGKNHRDDGPAVEHPDGMKQWYQHGKLHRKNAPAVEYPDGSREWWLDGVRVSAVEVFDNLNYDEKSEEVWRIDEWK